MDFSKIRVDRTPASSGYLIVGIPGSGKTTVGAALAKRFAAAAQIDESTLNSLIVSGWHAPDPNGDLEADRLILLRSRNAALLFDSYFSAGFTPIIADVVARRSHLDYYVRHITRRPLHIVVLVPDVSVALQRDASRPKNVAKSWASLDDVIRDELLGWGIWIDNSNLTVEETVDQILLLSNESGRQDKS